MHTLRETLEGPPLTSIIVSSVNQFISPLGPRWVRWSGVLLILDTVRPLVLTRPESVLCLMCTLWLHTIIWIRATKVHFYLKVIFEFFFIFQIKFKGLLIFTPFYGRKTVDTMKTPFFSVCLKRRKYKV